MKLGKLLISYNQIAIFNKSIDNPFNDWENEHINQGFSWRDKSVSFALIDNNETDIFINEIKSNILSNNFNPIRIIEVPFNIYENIIEISTIDQSFDYNIKNGDYTLTFELYFNNSIDKYLINLIFTNIKIKKARLILIDNLLKPANKLLMKSKPAK